MNKTLYSVRVYDAWMQAVSVLSVHNTRGEARKQVLTNKQEDEEDDSRGRTYTVQAVEYIA